MKAIETWGGPWQDLKVRRGKPEEAEEARGRWDKQKEAGMRL